MIHAKETGTSSGPFGLWHLRVHLCLTFEEKLGKIDKVLRSNEFAMGPCISFSLVAFCGSS